MNLQKKLDNIKHQLTSLATISEEIRRDSYTIEGKEKIMAIIERHQIFEPFLYGFGCFYRAMDEIYKQHDPEFSLPLFQSDCCGTDWVYTQEHDYLLLRISTSKHYSLTFIGFNHILDLHKKHTETHTPETNHRFIMDCVGYIENVARKMLTLPIFNANQLIFLSLMQHYYVNYEINIHPRLDYIIDSDIFGDRLGNDFKRMVFETNGSDPLSVRGSLPIITHYARKKALGHYDQSETDPSLLIKDMRSNKALNLRKAFDKMESYLCDTSATENKRIGFDCVVGVGTERYAPGLRMHGLSDKPIPFFRNRLRFGIFGSCKDPRETSFDEAYVGWTDFDGEEIVYDRFEDLFSCLEDDVVNTLEDNYNFLLEKLPTLREKLLRNSMLEYIMEGF